MTADAVGGVWQYSVDLIRELSDRGREVLLAVLGPAPSAEQQQMLPRLPGVQLMHMPFALEWMEQPWDGVARSKDWLLELAHRFRPDVVHLNGYALGNAAWCAPVVAVAHSCVVSWWQAVHGTEPPEDWREYRRQVQTGLESATAVIAPSHSMGESITRNYCIAPAKVGVIPNFSSTQPGKHVVKEPLILAAGRSWDEAKNLALLEEIAPQLAWRVAIAGGGEGGSDDTTVHYLGRVSHRALGLQMARASIFAHPALYEPFGLAVLEAARAQCCLVLADIPSLRELWDSAAVFVAPRDRRSWMETLNRLAEDETERKAMGERARSHAENYTAAAAVSGYLQLYADVARADALGADVLAGSSKGAAA